MSKGSIIAMTIGAVGFTATCIVEKILEIKERKELAIEAENELDIDFDEFINSEN